MLAAYVKKWLWQEKTTQTTFQDKSGQISLFINTPPSLISNWTPKHNAYLTTSFSLCLQTTTRQNNKYRILNLTKVKAQTKKSHILMHCKHNDHEQTQAHDTWLPRHFHIWNCIIINCPTKQNFKATETLTWLTQRLVQKPCSVISCSQSNQSIC